MNKKGFTLIELLIVVVIIGILAAIAIPRFSQTRERAFQSAVVSDLRNLQTVQEQYYADPASSFTYGDEGQIVTTGNLWTPSQGVAMSAWTATGTGWEATATHSGLPTTANSCTIRVGEAAENASVASGRIVCQWATGS
jgi:type IV pilus assembly protein PilA